MNYFFSFLAALVLIPCTAQDNVPKSIYAQASKSKTEKYIQRTDVESIVLGSAFSSETVEKIPIREQRILQIDLVYTSFRESSDFSQQDLNLRRLQKLLDDNPDLLENKFFEWRLVEQTGCNSSSQCRDFFHGFVVYYDKYYTRDDMKPEIDTITQIMANLETQLTQMDSLISYELHDMPCNLPPLNTSDGYVCNEFKRFYRCDERFSGMVFFTVEIDDKGRPVNVNIKGSLFPCKEILANILKHVLRWKRGIIIEGKAYPLIAEGKVTFPLDKDCISITGFRVPEELVTKFNVEVRGFDCAAHQVDSFYTEIIPKIEKEVVSTVLFRNQWEDDLFIVDATGSMYPYTSDLLKWLRLSTKKERTYVFFNDGDDKPTSQKVIGKTGGIDHVTTGSYLEVRKGLFRTMSKGGGGDLLENNIEALLYGVNVSGHNEAIMIVDNHSFPRDAALLRDYKVELKIILCGTDLGINTGYLDLARKHGFSIHTLTTDLPELGKLSPGQRIVIDGHAFVLEEDGFKRVVL